MVNVALNRLGQWLFPATCVLCGGPGRQEHAALDLCVACLRDLRINAPACAACALRLSGAADAALWCGRCLKKRPRFDAALCAFAYEYPVDHLIRALKFRGRLAYGRVLGELLAEHVLSIKSARRAANHSSVTNADADSPDFIIPVPLAEHRFRERGFNQAIEIGGVLEARLGIPLRANIARRTRNTREQAGLDAPARRKNLRRAFQVTMSLKGAHVAILDDVITTGSTMNELARTLKRAGAARVEAWAVARTAMS